MLRATITGLLLAAAGVSSADEFSYDLFNIGYGIVEFDDIDVDGDGVGVDGSFAIADNYHLFANYQVGDFDFNIDSTSYGLGIGYNRPVSDVVDLVARLSYEYVELDAPGFQAVDDNGFGLGVGIRFNATEQLELNAGLQYIDLSDSGDDTGFNAAALYNFNDVFSATLSGEWNDDASAYTLGGRFYFGR